MQFRLVTTPSSSVINMLQLGGIRIKDKTVIYDWLRHRFEWREGSKREPGQLRGSRTVSFFLEGYEVLCVLRWRCCSLLLAPAA